MPMHKKNSCTYQLKNMSLYLNRNSDREPVGLPPLPMKEISKNEMQQLIEAREKIHVPKFPTDRIDYTYNDNPFYPKSFWQKLRKFFDVF